MTRDLHRGARRQELAERAEAYTEGFADGVRAAMALLRSSGMPEAARVLDRAQVVDVPPAGGTKGDST